MLLRRSPRIQRVDLIQQLVGHAGVSRPRRS
ncbi:hypothetical protein ACKKBG_A29425 [Auxenochlorella protothecoides x Auxenochlorella symbiontica]